MKWHFKLAAIGMTVASLAIGLSGCAGTTKAPRIADGISDNISGKVLETADGGGYTYVCIEKDGKKIWAALPATKIAAGDQIKILGGAVMAPFFSKALNRNFDRIIFSGGLDQGTAAESPKAAALPSKPYKGPILAGKVLESIKAAGYTYILLEKDGNQGWAAVPTTDLTVGEEIELFPGMEMGNFQSKALKRSFDNIYFSGGVKGERKAAPVVATEAASAPAAGAADGSGAAAPLPQGHPSLDTDASAPAAVPLPSNHPKIAAPPAPAPVVAAPRPPLTGKVVETMTAGGYTYICLEKDSAKTWVAISRYPVSVGQELSLAPGSVMHNFTSRSLNRTFDQIIFTTKPQAN